MTNIIYLLFDNLTIIINIPAATFLWWPDSRFNFLGEDPADPVSPAPDTPILTWCPVFPEPKSNYKINPKSNRKPAIDSRNE